MNNKAFIITYYIDFYAYILFVLLFTLFYFLFIINGNKPLIEKAEQQTASFDQKLTFLFGIDQYLFKEHIRELLVKPTYNPEVIPPINTYLNKIIPHPTYCTYELHVYPARTKGDALLLPTYNHDETKITLNCIEHYMPISPP